MLLAIMNCSAIKSPTPEPELPNFDEQWDYDDPVLTEMKFLDILASVEFKQAPGYHLQLRTQIARTLGLQQKFDEAHALLDQVESQLTDETPIAKIRYLLERGRVLNSSGKKEASTAFFLEAWELGQEAKADFYAVDAAHMLGIVEYSENQLAWNEKAISMAENSFDPRARKWLGSLYNNVGWTYHDAGDYQTALAIFEKAFRFRVLHKQVREIQIAEWCIARTHRSLGNIDLALESQYKLEQEIRDSGGDEDGYVSEEIAECLLLQGKPDEAAPHFMKAWTLLSQDIWLQKNEADRLARLKELGSIKP